MRYVEAQTAVTINLLGVSKRFMKVPYSQYSTEYRMFDTPKTRKKIVASAL